MKIVSRPVKSLILAVVLALGISFSCIIQAGSTPNRTSPEDSFASCAAMGFGLGLVPVIGTAYTGMMALILSTMSHTDKSECVSGLVTGHAVGVAADIALLAYIWKQKGFQAAGFAATIPLVLGLSLVASSN